MVPVSRPVHGLTAEERIALHANRSLLCCRDLQPESDGARLSLHPQEPKMHPAQPDPLQASYVQR
jgi:hypothetical protein